ncbi:hypothetical protein PV327_003964 [Microctonus hyperodae]|uniref:RecQ-mediated genome instability protein 1 n=1 Tax=Microctonus hyperodae TaxID=165561 RepID=A0AA39G5J5_MICHY|nr:hypothetical protein PV327_003964 [Microctonus hyperodae]
MAKTFESIKKQLSAQYYFMNDSWLRDCLDYFLSEHPDADEADILSLIIHQWLLSDLREINNERGYLPKNIQQQKLLTLPGNYMLQIEKAYDISTSKYKQLEKIRNVSNENIEVTDAEKSQQPIPKTRRMLNLYLSDGIQDIIAMEYKPIPSLKKVVSGYKIMIKGPVVCRRGVILLEEKNIRMIGGEIESLLIENATENVLARALNLPENPDPCTYIINGDDDSQDLSDDNMDVDFDAVANIEKLNNTMSNLSATEFSKNISNTVPMVPIKKENSVMLNELPVCFKQTTENLDEVVDDADDEWIKMVDENNLDVIAADSEEPLDSNQLLQEFKSDSEFCEFEMNNLTEYDNYSLRQNVNPSKPQNMKTPVNNPSKLIIHKPTAKPQITNKIHNTESSSVTTSKIQTFIKSPLKLQPPPSAPPSKISTKQQTLKSQANNTKITDFMKKTDPKNKQSSSSSNRAYDPISNVKKIMPTSEIIYKTIRATPNSLQKLIKKDNNWYLEGSMTDGMDFIDVTFSPEVLEKLIGFTFSEFSQKRKLQKTNPQIKEELRLTLRNTETVLTRMDALLKLELIPGETKARIICITELTEEQKLKR